MSEGWGLDWSINGHKIVSSDDHGRLCIYDLENESLGSEMALIEGKKCLKMNPVFYRDFEA